MIPSSVDAPSVRSILGRWGRVVAALAIAAGMTLGAGGAALATLPVEAPLDLPARVHDSAGALGDDAASVEAALDRLETESPYALVIAFVPSFDGVGAQDWAQQTAELSGLADTDVLLAVAIEDRRYALEVGDAVALTDLQIQQIRVDRVGGPLLDDDWVTAATGAADGLREAAAAASQEAPVAETRASLVPILVSTLAVVGIIALAVWIADRRSKRQVAAARR